MRSARLIFLGCVVLAAAFQAAFAGGDRKEPTFIYVRSSNETVMSGDLSDLERVKKVLKQGQRALWTRTAAGKEFLIHDTATLDDVEKAWAPTRPLSEQMGKLGDQMGKLGKQMGKLGEQEGKLAVRQSKLEMQLDSLDRDDSRRAPLQRELRDIESKIDELEQQMRALEKQMKPFERQMKELEPKHEAATAKAQAGTQAVIQRAIASGVAKPF
jgi:chromosome segregation ATPase